MVKICRINDNYTNEDGTLKEEKAGVAQEFVKYIDQKDVPDEVIAVGNPSRVSRRNENKKVFK